MVSRTPLTGNAELGPVLAEVLTWLKASDLVDHLSGFAIGDPVTFTKPSPLNDTAWRIARIHVPRDGRSPYAGLEEEGNPNHGTAAGLDQLAKVPVSDREAVANAFKPMINNAAGAANSKILYAGVGISTATPSPGAVRAAADKALADMAELAALRAAVELHRPTMYDKYGDATTDPAQMKNRRCRTCSMSVDVDGCLTWRTARPAASAAPSHEE